MINSFTTPTINYVLVKTNQIVYTHSGLYQFDS